MPLSDASPTPESDPKTKSSSSSLASSRSAPSPRLPLLPDPVTTLESPRIRSKPLLSGDSSPARFKSLPSSTSLPEPPSCGNLRSAGLVPLPSPSNSTLLPSGELVFRFTNRTPLPLFGSGTKATSLPTCSLPSARLCSLPSSKSLDPAFPTVDPLLLPEGPTCRSEIRMDEPPASSSIASPPNSD